MQSKQFLDVARKWAESEPDCQAHRRSAVSRAYYAALLTSRQNLHALGIPISSGTTHVAVTDAMLQSKIGRLKILGKRLNTMKKDRVRADYYIDEKTPISMNDVRKALAESAEIHLSWETFLAQQA